MKFVENEIAICINSLNDYHNIKMGEKYVVHKCVEGVATNNQYVLVTNDLGTQAWENARCFMSLVSVRNNVIESILNE